MLRKLLKYEIKATARTFLPLYFVLVVFALVNNLVSFISDDMNFPAGIVFTLYILILIGMFVATLIVMIQRFYKSLLSDEGYLMFTIPVKPWMHIICKLLVSCMWTVASVIAAITSIFIIALQKLSLKDIVNGISSIWTLIFDELGGIAVSFILQMTIGAIIGLITGTLVIYASIAIGQLSNNHKIMASIGSFLAIYTVSQIVAAGAILLPFSAKISNNNVITNTSVFINYPHNIIWYSIALSAIFSVIYFAITNVILSRKLNLE